MKNQSEHKKCVPLQIFFHKSLFSKPWKYRRKNVGTTLISQQPLLRCYNEIVSSPIHQSYEKFAYCKLIVCRKKLMKPIFWINIPKSQNGKNFWSTLGLLCSQNLLTIFAWQQVKISKMLLGYILQNALYGSNFIQSLAYLFPGIYL